MATLEWEMGLTRETKASSARDSVGERGMKILEELHKEPLTAALLAKFIGINRQSVDGEIEVLEYQKCLRVIRTERPWLYAITDDGINTLKKHKRGPYNG